MTISKNSFKAIALIAARAGDDKKADPVKVYDLAGKSPLADYAVLLAVESPPQLEAVSEEVQVRLKNEAVYCLHKDGMRSKNWKVLDYGGVLVHIYDVKAEEFYSIGKVYGDYKPVEWQEKPAASPVANKTSAKPAAKKAAAKKPAVKRAPKKSAAKKAKPAVKKTAAKRSRPAVKKAKPAAKKNAAKKGGKKKISRPRK